MVKKTVSLVKKVKKIVWEKNEKPQETNHQKFLHPCEGRKCPAHGQCSAGNRIVDGRDGNVCLLMRKRFGTKSAPEKFQTRKLDKVKVEALIKEVK